MSVSDKHDCELPTYNNSFCGKHTTCGKCLECGLEYHVDTVDGVEKITFKKGKTL